MFLLNLPHRDISLLNFKNTSVKNCHLCHLYGLSIKHTRDIAILVIFVSFS